MKPNVFFKKRITVSSENPFDDYHKPIIDCLKTCKNILVEMKPPIYIMGVFLSIKEMVESYYILTEKGSKQLTQN